MKENVPKEIVAEKGLGARGNTSVDGMGQMLYLGKRKQGIFPQTFTLYLVWLHPVWQKNCHLRARVPVDKMHVPSS